MTVETLSPATPVTAETIAPQPPITQYNPNERIRGLLTPLADREPTPDELDILGWATRRITAHDVSATNDSGEPVTYTTYNFADPISGESLPLTPGVGEGLLGYIAKYEADHPGINVSGEQPIDRYPVTFTAADIDTITRSVQGASHMSVWHLHRNLTDDASRRDLGLEHLPRFNQSQSAAIFELLQARGVVDRVPAENGYFRIAAPGSLPPQVERLPEIPPAPERRQPEECAEVGRLAMLASRILPRIFPSEHKIRRYQAATDRRNTAAELRAAITAHNTAVAANSAFRNWDANRGWTVETAPDGNITMTPTARRIAHLEELAASAIQRIDQRITLAEMQRIAAMAAREHRGGDRRFRDDPDTETGTRKSSGRPSRKADPETSTDKPTHRLKYVSPDDLRTVPEVYRHLFADRFLEEMAEKTRQGINERKRAGTAYSRELADEVRESVIGKAVAADTPPEVVELLHKAQRTLSKSRAADKRRKDTGSGPRS